MKKIPTQSELSKHDKIFKSFFSGKDLQKPKLLNNSFPTFFYQHEKSHLSLKNQNQNQIFFRKKVSLQEINASFQPVKTKTDKQSKNGNFFCFFRVC